MDGDADLVIVGVSARVLAGAARRARHVPIVLDLFRDEDTSALSSKAIEVRHRPGRLAFDADDLMEKLDANAPAGLPAVLGTGFEDEPELVAQIAATRPVLGNDAARIARVKDPEGLAALASRLGIPHPRLFCDRAPDGVVTLAKKTGASGGWHVRPSRRVRHEGWYLQEKVSGEPVSALFLGNGRKARILAFSQQWCAPAQGSPYRYGGAVGPIELPILTSIGIADALDRLVDAIGLVGLMSADLMVDGAVWHLLEINPRPGATLDVFDHPPLPPLLTLHRDACSGMLPEAGSMSVERFDGARAAGVLYAAADIDMHLAPLPEDIADRPSLGRRIRKGEPVCTVRSHAPDAERARAILAMRMAGIWDALIAAQPGRVQ
ncbi:ATP-grasp domain-containing protein [Ancylobacter sp. 6x-1]|uniref:ATP-grasp domain-containing protein n=1 Tax=Ancylobacter crimeensis TaxID=2579147 RepID=A0ABT0D8N0_9HYPH|nr:ATP-grasp domain-containing protein [Ancylobacter crimeensis]MCK0196301.1 ATP-grasp domain-containing protein [Ancylobacter crimeensis]